MLKYDKPIPIAGKTKRKYTERILTMWIMRS